MQPNNLFKVPILGDSRVHLGFRKGIELLDPGDSDFLVLAAFDVVASAFKFASGLPKWFAGVVGAVVVLAAIQQIAYLLRVVYPSPKRLAQRDEQGESETEP